MKKRILLGAFLTLSLLASCQQKENLQNVSDELNLSMEASVYASSGSSRVSTDESGVTTFSEGDELGFFMPEEDEPVKWTLSGSQWTPEFPLSWKDKVSKFSYCAYYPYSSEATVRGDIPMPDLSLQKGTLAGIGEFDFLTARCEVSYQETDNGKVSFTGESSFRHAYSLISITIKKDLPEENVLISQASFKGDNLFGNSTYHFAESEAEDGISYLELPEVDALTLNFEEPVTVVEDTGYTLFLLCNPQDLVEDSEFFISYQRDGISYTASTQKLGNQFAAGKYYQFILKLTKAELSLEGCEVSDWISEKLPEIAIEETPA